MPNVRSYLIYNRRIAHATHTHFSDHGLLDTLHKLATNKKSGYERESAAIAFQSLATVLGPPIVPLLLPSLTVLFDLYMDKGEVVRIAATAAVRSILKLCPPESTRIILRKLEDILEHGKWRTKVGVLESLKIFVTSARSAVAIELGTVLPKVESAMHDTKQEASHPQS
jgi:elongation factor 3